MSRAQEEEAEHGRRGNHGPAPQVPAVGQRGELFRGCSDVLVQKRGRSNYADGDIEEGPHVGPDGEVSLEGRLELKGGEAEEGGGEAGSVTRGMGPGGSRGTDACVERPVPEHRCHPATWVPHVLSRLAHCPATDVCDCLGDRRLGRLSDAWKG